MALKNVEGFWFSWDDKKSEWNLRNRKFDFEAAIDAFFDEYAVLTPNIEWEGEERQQLIGCIAKAGIIAVIHAVWSMEFEDEKVIRIISARRADRSERKEYFGASEA